ncbi:MAG: hypothetical protein PHQ89_05680 [Bacilli bacterium]|nr:hypothetical protein [Bacilli bacterium]
MSLIMGFFAFIMFYLYDFNQIVLKKKVCSLFFIVGCVLLLSASILLLSLHLPIMVIDAYHLCLLLIAICFLFLLIHTLFFSLPFEETYRKESLATQQNKCYRNGMYALCRHPGVLWMFGFYFMLSLAFNSKLMWQACLLFNLMNFIYIVIQDNWTFMYLFCDYYEYKQQVPFLLPNIKSIHHCINSWGYRK